MLNQFFKSFNKKKLFVPSIYDYSEEEWYRIKNKLPDQFKIYTILNAIFPVVFVAFVVSLFIMLGEFAENYKHFHKFTLENSLYFFVPSIGMLIFIAYWSIKNNDLFYEVGKNTKIINLKDYDLQILDDRIEFTRKDNAKGKR